MKIAASRPTLLDDYRLKMRTAFLEQFPEQNPDD